MPNYTPLYAAHVQAGAKFIDFSGWDMPIHYGSQLNEHKIVREDCGMFDVSHMTIVDIEGTQATDFLQHLLANNVAKLTAPGKALYSLMLNEQGGIIDDLIVYRTNSGYRTVVNCATREKDLHWLTRWSNEFDVTLVERSDLAMLAIQGPQAIAKTNQALAALNRPEIGNLSVFSAYEDENWFVARTGYTGEDGVEVMLPNDQVLEFWQRLLAKHVSPVGLGARDTLRLEAGMHLYGSDMTEENHPLESGLGWTVAWSPESRNFIGRNSLEQIKSSSTQHRFVGLVLDGRGVLRSGQKVIDRATNAVVGELTSGTFSPTLSQSIAMARIQNNIPGEISVVIREKPVPVSIIKLPFVRHGKKQF